MLPKRWTDIGKFRDLWNKEEVMKLYLSQNNTHSARSVVLDDMILTTELPTTAGSKMLDGYKSLFEAEVVTKLKNANFDIAGKANVGEMSLGLLGESSYFGAVTDKNGNLSLASSEILAQGDVMAAVGLDAGGAIMRSAALSGQVCIKPTYATVSPEQATETVPKRETVA